MGPWAALDDSGATWPTWSCSARTSGLIASHREMPPITSLALVMLLLFVKPRQRVQLEG